MLEKSLASICHDGKITDEFENRLEYWSAQSAYIYFDDTDDVRLCVDVVGEDLESVLSRVEGCLNSCRGVSSDELGDGLLLGYLTINQNLKGVVKKLFDLAVRSEFELATCADRGRGDVDHNLLPDLRSAIAELKSDAKG